MILAAGLGTRLRPVTEHIPKTLLPVCNVPLLENVLLNLDRAGLGGFAVNTHHLSEAVAEFIQNSPFRDRITVFHEAVILGTGGGIANARDFLAGEDHFLVHNSDILTNLDIRGIIRQHLATGAKVTMALLDGPENKVLTAPDGRIFDILGKLGQQPPEANGRLLTYAGIMILSKEIFDFLPARPEFSSIITAVLAMIQAFPGCAAGYIPEKIYWNDLGTLPAWFQAHRDILVERKLQLPQFSRCNSTVRIAAGASISPDAETAGFICLGADADIAAGAHVADCILLAGGRIAAGETRRNEVIGSHFSIHRDLAKLAQLRILQGMDLSATQINSLREQGSSREFLRLEQEGGSQILMLSNADDPDFERFVEFGRYLGRFDFPTPAINQSCAEEYSVLMEDLGDLSLFRAVKTAAGDEETEALYHQVLDELDRWHCRGNKIFKADGAPPLRIFDFAYLRWETDYFRQYFLSDLCGIPLETLTPLTAEFDRLAHLVEQHPRVFMHRDFQSQNIMLQNGKIRFVDYQGARSGSIGYDAMSLIHDPYAALNANLRNRLMRYFAASIQEKCNGDAMLLLYQAGLQRLMQALGAYGFLSLHKGKKQYLRHIPAALRFLSEMLSALHRDYGFMVPELQNVLFSSKVKKRKNQVGN